MPPGNLPKKIEAKGKRYKDWVYVKHMVNSLSFQRERIFRMTTIDDNKGKQDQVNKY